MSLLLKALKRAGDKAAGERAGGRDPSASLADSLSLEPIEPASRNTASDTRHAGWGARSTPASPRASRLAPWLSGERSLVPAVAVLAAVVMLGYAAYVYWQTRPQPVLTPPPATQAGLPSAHVSAPAAAQLATLPEIKPAAPPAAAPRWGSGVSGKPAASGRATPPRTAAARTAQPHPAAADHPPAATGCGVAGFPAGAHRGGAQPVPASPRRRSQRGRAIGAGGHRPRRQQCRRCGTPLSACAGA